MSLGSKLKASRERKGLSVEELSERTHVGSQIIEDFEAGRFGHITAAVYGNGFIKILATALGVDAEPLRAEFCAEYQAWADKKASIVVPKAPPLKFSEKRLSERPEPAGEKAARARPGRALFGALFGKPRREDAEGGGAFPPPPTMPPPPPPKPAVSAEPREPEETEAPAKAEPVRAASPAAAPDEADGEGPLGFGELFERRAPAPRKPEPPRGEERPPQHKFPVIRPAPTWNDAGPQVEAGGEPATPIFHDSLGPRRPRIDIPKLFAKAKGLAAAIPLRTLGIVAAIAAVAAGLCLLLLGGSGKETPAADEAPGAPAASFSGSALTDRLLPPPDCYAE